MLASTLVALVALSFAAMGVYALVWPERIVALFGAPGLTLDGRNEVRAVYGGFGVAVAGLLFAALRGPGWAPGVFLAVAVALFGMAGGRLISIAVDRTAGRFPWLFLGIEVVSGAALLLAFRDGGMS